MCKIIMNKKFRFYLLLVGIVGSLIILLTGCASIQDLFKNPRYIYENEAVLVGGDDKPIELINAPNTVDITYAKLLAFIKQDPTDQILYVDRGQPGGLVPFVCSDFAEAVHNNAEAAGIRAGYVGIDWEDGGLGHAINVFETTDMGTVFVDCTGKSIYSQIENVDSQFADSSWDKIAYLEIGQIYGVLSLDKAKSPAYEFYREFEQKWDLYKTRLAAYNGAVKQYNQDIRGKVFRAGSRELKDIEAREQELVAEEKVLDALRQQIGTTSFKPLGVVKSISVHW
jgi:hypothetical protein